MDRFKDMRRPRRVREGVKGDQEKPKKERVLAKKAPGAHTCNPLNDTIVCLLLNGKKYHGHGGADVQNLRTTETGNS